MAVTIDVVNVGELKTRATHGPSGATLGTAAPVDNQGDGSSFSPTDLLATALATCALTVMAIAARRHGVDLRGARATVTKEMSADMPRRVVRLPMTLSMPSGIAVDLRAGLEEVGRRCPVACSLSEAIDAPMTFRWG